MKQVTITTDIFFFFSRYFFRISSDVLLLLNKVTFDGRVTDIDPLINFYLNPMWISIFISSIPNEVIQIIFEEIDELMNEWRCHKQNHTQSKEMFVSIFFLEQLHTELLCLSTIFKYITYIQLHFTCNLVNQSKIRNFDVNLFLMWDNWMKIDTACDVVEYVRFFFYQYI